MGLKGNWSLYGVLHGSLSSAGHQRVSVININLP